MREPEPLTVLVWSDVVCPFCYIGKRKLEHALAEWPGRDRVRVVWKSFQLQPDARTDPSKNAMQSLVERKGWTMEAARAAAADVTARAKSVGLDFDLANTKVANTFDAHRLTHLADARGHGDAMVERLFRAYFTEGSNVGDSATLSALATDVGLAAEEVERRLSTEAYAAEVRHDIDEALQLGINGVPFFVFDGRYAVSGAQDVEVFLEVLRKVSG